MVERITSLPLLDNPIQRGVTWKCHSCQDIRADHLISVLTFPLKAYPWFMRNWRYCNDRDECLKIAIKKSRTL